MAKYYAVRVGRHPGIYRTWGKCESEVSRYKGAEFKAFMSLVEAEDYMSGIEDYVHEENEVNIGNTRSDIPYAFVDGSFNGATCTYGYGGFLMHDGIKEVVQETMPKWHQCVMLQVKCLEVWQLLRKR